MIGEANIYGLYVPWLLPLALVALFALLGVQRVLARLGVYRHIWHPALFDMSLYVLLLFAVSWLSQLFQSLP